MVHKFVRIGIDSAVVIRNHFNSLLLIDEKEHYDDAIMVEIASALFGDFIDVFGPIDDKLFVEAVKIIFSNMTNQMDDSNPLRLRDSKSI